MKDANRKTFVVNPHSLLSSSDSLLKFGSDNDVVVPEAVLEKIQRIKPNLSFDKRKTAKEILSYINSFDASIFSSKGVVQSNGSNLMVATNFSNIEIPIEGIDEFDKRALQVCKGLQEEGRNVVFITNNIVLQIKAKEVGVYSETFKDELYPIPAEQYKGRIQVYISKEVATRFHNSGEIGIEDIYEYDNFEFVENQFVIMISGQSSSSLGRVKGSKVVKLDSMNSNIYGIIPKNVGQHFLVEALMSDAPLVVCKGGAGTGKTFCSLAAGLQQYDNEKFKQILVTRPIQTVSNEKIGFLPGDIDDKVGPYLGGIKDNLCMLLDTKEHSFIKDGKSFKENGEMFFERGIIRIQPIGYIRGRTIVDSFFIIDETQNLDPEDIKSIVTRAGEGSKFIFLGDPSQVDNTKLNERYNGLVYLSERMKGQELCYQITMEEEESVRGNLAKLAVKIL